MQETISDYIKRKGLKHKVVAKAMGMTYSAWYKSRILNYQNISIQKLHCLANFLNIQPTQAFELIYKYYLQTDQSLPVSLVDKPSQ